MKLNLERLGKNRVFTDNLRWDITPEFLFKPRFVRDAADRDLVRETQGFMFYIDYMDGRAALMVMKTYNMTSKTVGEVEDVPEEMLLRAVTREGAKDIACMYPIDEAVEAWLRERLAQAP